MIKYIQCKQRIKKMANKKRNRLASWMITRPALFAVISFITMTAASAVVGMLGSQTASLLGVGLIIIAFLGRMADTDIAARKS